MSVGGVVHLMSLQNVYDDLLAMSSQPGLSFASLAPKIPSLGSVLENLPPVSFLIFKDFHVSLAGAVPAQSLSISATLDWGFLQDVSAIVTVTPDSSAAGKFISAVEFTLPDSAKLTIPGLNWFEIDRFKLSGISA